MKLVLLCGDEPLQRGLAQRLSRIAPLAAIVKVRPRSRPATLRSRLGRLARGLTGLPLRRAWKATQAHFDQLAPEFPEAPMLAVESVNAPDVAALIAEIRPDFVLVSGTDLLRRPLIEAIERGGGQILNLHTGISPYVKGGPNCTNWCLATGRFDLIGNTILWIDPGIDSGDIVATERTPLSGRETLAELHIAVIDHGHDLYGRALARLVSGAPLPRVAQAEIGSGRTFMTKEWTAAAAARAVANFHLHHRRAALTALEPLTLIALEGADSSSR